MVLLSDRRVLVSNLISSFRRSCGPRSLPLPPPGTLSPGSSRKGFSIPTARRFSSNVANSRSRAFRESICAQEKSPYEFIRVCTRGDSNSLMVSRATIVSCTKDVPCPTNRIMLCPIIVSSLTTVSRPTNRNMLCPIIVSCPTIVPRPTIVSVRPSCHVQPSYRVQQPSYRVRSWCHAPTTAPNYSMCPIIVSCPTIAQHIIYMVHTYADTSLVVYCVRCIVLF